MLCIGLIIICTFFFSDGATQRCLLSYVSSKIAPFLYSYAGISFQFWNESGYILCQFCEAWQVCAYPNQLGITSVLPLAEPGLQEHMKHKSS